MNKSFKMSIFFGLLLMVQSVLFASTQILISEKEGEFRCAGGGNQNYVLAKTCKKLTLQRVVFGSTMAYEAYCIDTNNKDHEVSCQSYSFTHKNKLVKKESFWTKSNKNKK